VVPVELRSFAIGRLDAEPLPSTKESLLGLVEWPPSEGVIKLDRVELR